MRIFAIGKDRRDIVARREPDDLVAKHTVERLGGDHETRDLLLRHAGEHGRQRLLAPGQIDNDELAAKRGRGLLHRRDPLIGCCRRRQVRIEQERNRPRWRKKLAQHLEPLGVELLAAAPRPGHVAFRPGGIGDQAKLVWIARDGKHDRDDEGRLHGGPHRRRARQADDRLHALLHQLGREQRKPFPPSLRGEIFDHQSLPVDKTGVLELVQKRIQTIEDRPVRDAVEHADPHHRRLLRARCERHGGTGRRASHCGQHMPPPDPNCHARSPRR